MATGHFAPCPHCNAPLSYLEGAAGSTMTPACPRCRRPITVSRAHLLMAITPARLPETQGQVARGAGPAKRVGRRAIARALGDVPRRARIARPRRIAPDSSPYVRPR